ncbi:efflux RND transporter periplasmic adaptor subunit [Exilibacterium tricleocarpae]|uniref:Efflux RND transporter periplasmic adaptor subunit n=1 Tax=Exilibacterium tricleocarpae TaxID=2591008 RepID=A0A545T0J2_9GAMM|nr:efflux RND transporter periplasmic adaptor subunit [Exilibacterium tricleocarpae]TQV70720.1 efflux RND transporter periplasmic adaptor subunit [Exilibacterium tricleocarpae]
MLKRKFLYWALLVAPSVLLMACGAKEAEQSREAQVRPVKLITLAGASGQETARFPGVIDADQITDLSFQVSGLLQELPVKEAQEVEAGALIAKLDQRDFRNQAASAKAQYDNAEKEYQRVLRLSKQGAVAKSMLDQRLSERDIAKANLEIAEKALGDTVIEAPFAGTLAQIPVQRLQTIQAGQLVARLMAVESLEVTINLPARIVSQVPAQEDTGIAYVTLEAAPGTRIEAMFEEASLVADATSQTYAVTFTFKPPEDLLILPGMNATVELSRTLRNAGGEGHRVAVPLPAVMSEGDANYVWVLNSETMTVARREVTLKQGIGETVTVTKGLMPGETIVGAGAAYLAEGMTVRAWTD